MIPALRGPIIERGIEFGVVAGNAGCWIDLDYDLAVNETTGDFVLLFHFRDRPPIVSSINPHCKADSFMPWTVTP